MSARREEHILELKEQLNTRNPADLRVFTRYKIITYVFNIVFPPYAWFRIWRKKSEFCLSEKLVQTLVGVIYISTLIEPLL